MQPPPADNIFSFLERPRETERDTERQRRRGWDPHFFKMHTVPQNQNLQLAPPCTATKVPTIQTKVTNVMKDNLQRYTETRKMDWAFRITVHKRLTYFRKAPVIEYDVEKSTYFSFRKPYIEIHLKTQITVMPFIQISEPYLNSQNNNAIRTKTPYSAA